MLSRLARLYDVTANLDAATAIPVKLAVVREVFRVGTIKIIRQRSWPVVPEDTRACQSTFDDASARAALAAFRARYRELRSYALAGASPALGSGLRSALEGLGYLEPAEAAPASVRHGFVLPLPGANLPAATRGLLPAER